MSLIMGALAGLGEAGQRMGEINQKAWNDQEWERQKIELAAQREQALEKFKAEMKVGIEDSNRAKMSDAINSGAKKIIDQRFAGNQVEDPTTWTPEQEAVRSQAMQSQAASPSVMSRSAAGAGYIEEAQKLDKIAESGNKTTPWGSVTHDSEGNVIYDNASSIKGSIAQQAADAATARSDAYASGRGGAKPLDQAHIDSIVKQSQGLVDNVTKNKINPYAMTPEEKGDTAYNGVLKSKVTEAVSKAALRGEVANPSSVINDLNKLLAKADTLTRQKADAAASAIFEKEGAFFRKRVDKDAIDELKKDGYPDYALTDANSFKKFYREANLETNMNILGQQEYQKSKAASKDAGKPDSEKPKPAAQEQKVEPAKPAAKAEKTAEYGLLTSQRLGYLEKMESFGQLDPKEKLELQQLRDSKAKNHGNEWWRGKASEASYE